MCYYIVNNKNKQKSYFIGPSPLWRSPDPITPIVFEVNSLPPLVKCLWAHRYREQYSDIAAVVYHLETVRYGTSSGVGTRTVPYQIHRDADLQCFGSIFIEFGSETLRIWSCFWTRFRWKFPDPDHHAYDYFLMEFFLFLFRLTMCHVGSGHCCSPPPQQRRKSNGDPAHISYTTALRLVAATAAVVTNRCTNSRNAYAHPALSLLHCCKATSLR